MQSRQSVKAALVKEIDAVRHSISRLQHGLCRERGPDRNSWPCGYQLTAQKVRLARLETVLANRLSAPTGLRLQEQP
ncbi:hypothetical protein X738_28005 [Mesorhizobium sp. LNHC209A00]|nr:hypothetical protein X738_28005 [Mesorhizobium sp. LNHC209A00]